MRQYDSFFARSAMLMVLLLIVFAAYYPGLNGPFVLDDASNIPQTKIENLNTASLKEVAFSNNSGLFGRPIPVATFALNHYFGDSTPFAFKLTNLIIHLINTLLVFQLIKHLTQLVLPSRNTNLNQSEFLTIFAITTIWALHPLQVSTVMYSVQRMTLLMTTFSLLALITYSQARAISAERPTKCLSLLLLTGFFTLLACFSKENGALVVIYIGFLELLTRYRKPKNAPSKKELLLSNTILIFVASSIVIGAVYLMFTLDRINESYRVFEFSMTERIATQGDVLLLYLKNIVIPDISNMNLYLDEFSIIQLDSLNALYSYLVLGMVVTVAIFLIKINPLITFGIIFFFLSHLLESTIVPLEIAFEHRNYIGIIGIATAVVYLTKYLFSMLGFKFVKIAIAITTLLILSSQTYSRNLEWSDDLILHTLALENNPQSRRARLTLAISHARRSNLKEAVHLFEDAAKNDKKDAYSQLLLIQFKAFGGIFSPNDLSLARELLTSRPITTDVTMILDDMLTKVKNDIYKEPNLIQISELIYLATNNDNLRISKRNQAALYARLANSLSLRGKHEESLAALNKALRLNSRNPEIILMTAESLVNLNRPENIAEILKKIPSDIHITIEQRIRIKRLEELAKIKSKKTGLAITQSVEM